MRKQYQTFLSQKPRAEAMAQKAGEPKFSHAKR
jgi:hypothetical protein